jgi:hypothetical protein
MAEARERPRRPRPDGSKPGVVVVALVRARSVRRREPLVLGGHERSPSEYENSRSRGLHRYDLGRRNRMGPGSNPTSRSGVLGRVGP